MALTEGDKAECKEIARAIVREVLEMHIAVCPHGRTLLSSRWLLFGVCIGSGFGGGAFVLALIKALAVS